MAGQGRVSQNDIMRPINIIIRLIIMFPDNIAYN